MQRSFQPSSATDAPEPDTAKKANATDIDQIDGKAVSDYDKDPEVKRLVDAYQAKMNRILPTPAENYGPAGLYRGGKKFQSPKLAANHTDHIHVRPGR